MRMHQKDHARNMKKKMSYLLLEEVFDIHDQEFNMVGLISIYPKPKDK